MGKKMKLIPFLFKNISDSSTSWPWPSCSSHPKTLSFRAAAATADIFRSANSAFSVKALEPRSSSSSSAAEMEYAVDEEAVISGLRAGERLFFEPGETSSILEEAKSLAVVEEAEENIPFKGSLVTAMDSVDPVMDFRRSMEEMVEAHGLNDWAGLEELLGWYFRANGQSNHGYIVGAFVDLLLGLSFASSSSISSSSTSLSSSPSNVSCSEKGDHLLLQEEHCSNSSLTMSHSLTSALSFSSSTTSSISPTSLFLLEAEEDEIKKTITNASSSSSSSS